MRKKKGKSPAVQATPINLTPGKGGVVPPVEHRFPPGVSGNPGGSRTAGAHVKEWMNALMDDETITLKKLRSIAASKTQHPKRIAAAIKLVRMCETADIADYADWLDGTKTLKQLRAAGIDTAILKKAEIGDKGGRKIELHDRAGEDFDRVMDRTEGKPKQVQERTTNVIFRTPDDRAAAADVLAARLRAILKPSRN